MSHTARNVPTLAAGASSPLVQFGGQERAVAPETLFPLAA